LLTLDKPRLIYILVMSKLVIKYLIYNDIAYDVIGKIRVEQVLPDEGKPPQKITVCG